MARTSTFPLVDRIVGGDLHALLLAWQADGDTFADMAYRLRYEYGVRVAASTVHRWVVQSQDEMDTAS